MTNTSTNTAHATGETSATPPVPAAAALPGPPGRPADEGRYSRLVAWGVIAGLVAFTAVLLEQTVASLQAGRTVLFAVNLASIPLGVVCLAFPLSALLRNLVGIYAPATRLLENSRFYASRPRRLLPPETWPAVTIQIPVYTENFELVIRQTLHRAMKAAKGKANIVVYDDGLLVLAGDDLAGAEARIARKRETGAELDRAEVEIAARLQFYRARSIGFVARSRKDRPGLFKKAGNLNVGMNLADAAVRALAAQPADLPPGERLRRALASAVAASPVPVVAEGDIRLGEYLVLLDKDSDLPVDAIGATLPEFMDDERVGFTQHRTRVFNADENLFAKMIGRFTENLFYLVFSFVTRDGDGPPLVGHNVMLRTQALRDVARRDGEFARFWETRISEDFDVMQRLATAGYHGKYVAFPEMDFGEGVTRSYGEEVAKWFKFACGAAEMTLNPIAEMPRKGILTETFRSFLHAPALPWTSKLGVATYLSSYAALALPVVLFPVLALLAFAGLPVERAVPSTIWTTALSLLLFFVLGGAVLFFVRAELSMSRASGMRGRRSAVELWRDVACTAFFLAFFSAVSWACFKGFACHLLGLRPQFGATNMDKVRAEGGWLSLVLAILKECYGQIIAAVACLIALVLLHEYRHESYHPVFSGFALIALGHLVVPFVLNAAVVQAIPRPVLHGLGFFDLLDPSREREAASEIGSSSERTLAAPPVEAPAPFLDAALCGLVALALAARLWLVSHLPVRADELAYAATAALPSAPALGGDPLVWPLAAAEATRLLGAEGPRIIAAVLGAAAALFAYLAAGAAAGDAASPAARRGGARLALAIVALAAPALAAGAHATPEALGAALAGLGLWLLLAGTRTGSRPALLAAGLAWIAAMVADYTLVLYLPLLGAAPLVALRSGTPSGPRVTVGWFGVPLLLGIFAYAVLREGYLGHALGAAPLPHGEGGGLARRIADLFVPPGGRPAFLLRLAAPMTWLLVLFGITGALVHRVLAPPAAARPWCTAFVIAGVGGLWLVDSAPLRFALDRAGPLGHGSVPMMFAALAAASVYFVLASQPRRAASLGAGALAVLAIAGHSLIVLGPWAAAAPGGAPVEIRGAVAAQSLEVLASIGGNSVRTRDHGPAERRGAILERARSLGLAVTVGLGVRPARSGFDYGDADAERDQLDRLSGVVRELKDHPSVLAFAVGEELEVAPPADGAWRAVEALARLCREVAGGRPVLTIVRASDLEVAVPLIRERCPSVQVLGVNRPEDLGALAGRLARCGWTGPFIVTEWVPGEGADATPAPTSTRVAAMLADGLAAVSAGSGGRCLGVYVGGFGPPDGDVPAEAAFFGRADERTPLLEALQRSWLGTAPLAAAPVLGEVALEGSAGGAARLAPGAEAALRVAARDPDGDALEYAWSIAREPGGAGPPAGARGPGSSASPGAATSPAARIEGGDDGSARLRAPSEPGDYRVRVDVRDGRGHVASASLALEVRR